MNIKRLIKQTKGKLTRDLRVSLYSLFSATGFFIVGGWKLETDIILSVLVFFVSVLLQYKYR